MTWRLWFQWKYGCVACLVAVAIVLAPALSAMAFQPGQGLNFPRFNLQQPFERINLPPSVGDVVTDGVNLDGYKLFTIATPAVNKQQQKTNLSPIRERVQGIESVLQRIAESRFDPKTLQVTAAIDPTSNLPVVTIDGQYLMTVTTLDAQIQGHDPERWANEVTRIVKTALLRARQERQPEFLTRQAWVAGLILLVMTVGSRGLARLQRSVRRRQQVLETEPPAAVEMPISVESPAIATVHDEMNRRRQRNLADIYRRLLQLQQLVIWGIGWFFMLGLFPYTRWLQPIVLSVPLQLIALLLAIYLAIRLSDVLVDRFLAAFERGEFIAPDASQRLTLRVSTFSRVLDSIVVLVWVTVGIFAALSIIGVDVVPVLAGAGILGLAISFASQNLIKDMINGFLILMEDQYAVGDMIAVGAVSGLVENMNLRITQIRNAEGRLITIPNGAISIVENLSKDWARVDLAVDVAYSTDLDQAIQVIQQVAHQMDSDPLWRELIIDPPEVLGIDRMAQTGVTIRVWIKTQPLQQWTVAREFRRRLKLALEQAEIAIGTP